MAKAAVVDTASTIEAAFTLIGYVGKAGFPAALIRTMRLLVPQDTGLVPGAHKDGGPVVLEGDARHVTRTGNLWIANASGTVLSGGRMNAIEALAMMRRIKTLFDPDNILNPGKTFDP